MAWLLGPKFEMQTTPDGSVYLVDSPVLPLFPSAKQLVKRGRWRR